MWKNYTNGEPSKIVIPHFNGECTLEDIQLIVNGVRDKQQKHPFLKLSLDLNIVQALIDKIIDLETNKIFPAMG